MDAENENEIKKWRDAIHILQTIQSMIDVSADRLEGLRTQCLTSAELTQQEIRTLEGKLVKHFSRQMLIKAKFGDELMEELKDVPSLRLWLRVVGVGQEYVEMICSKVSTLEQLYECSDYELKAMLPHARDEEVRRLVCAMSRLKTYMVLITKNRGISETCNLPLYWDSWERPSPRATRARPRPSGDDARGRTGGDKSPPPSNKRKQSATAAAAAAAVVVPKSRSHEAPLARAHDTSDLSDTSQSSVVGVPESPPLSPREDPSPPASGPVLNNSHHAAHYNNCKTAACVGTAPRSPRTPTVGVRPGMVHDIAHRFTKTFKMIATCDYCDKQMLFGSGLKCKECKFKCHRDCESKVPPSCGLPPEFVLAFREKLDGYYGAASPLSGRAGSGFLSSLTHRPRRRPADRPNNASFTGGPDSSSTTSSCNSSTPSSPAPPPAPCPAPCPAPSAPCSGLPSALAPPSASAPPSARAALLHNQQFHFPDVKTPVSSPSHVLAQSPSRVPNDNHEEFSSSNKSEISSRCVSLSGSGSTDSGGGARADSLDDNPTAAAAAADAARWPRQNSLSMKEWDIPYDELKLFERIGEGRFGTVYRGSWHGAVAVKLLHVPALGDETALETFKHEVATFRKTRHENLVLFMGACMKPPKLAIVTSLCKGMTLFTHIHLRRDKFNANKSVIVAQQLSQGMGYLHARGIIHKDLKSKNIFLENGKVVITDFGLFSVTKLCVGNHSSGDKLSIPLGWLGYLAPELVRALRPHASVNLPFSKATDVYAFGTVWYELLCGEWPFNGQPHESVIWQAGKGVKQSLANLQASRDIKDILMLCWSYHPSERPDFAHLLATLEKLPRKRLARSPSHPVQLSRSADSVL